MSATLSPDCELWTRRDSFRALAELASELVSSRWKDLVTPVAVAALLVVLEWVSPEPMPVPTITWILLAAWAAVNAGSLIAGLCIRARARIDLARALRREQLAKEHLRAAEEHLRAAEERLRVASEMRRAASEIST